MYKYFETYQLLRKKDFRGAAMHSEKTGRGEGSWLAWLLQVNQLKFDSNDRYELIYFSEIDQFEIKELCVRTLNQNFQFQYSSHLQWQHL